MEQQELDSLVSTPDDLINKIKAEKSAATDTILTYQKQYDSKQHDVTNKTLRQDKTVETDNGTTAVAVARLPIPFQKKIVSLAAAFLCGNPIELSAAPADQSEIDFMTVVRRAWKDNKLDYESKKLAKLMMSETEVAELWYTEAVEPGYWKGTINDKPAVKFRLRMKIIANKYGDSLYPVFNSAGDMIAFGRSYQLKVENKKEDHFDVYTISNVYKNVKIDGGAWTSTPEPNPIGKIPVIYYSQEFPEWNDVQEMIDRLEKLISNHADTNDYFGSPMVFVQGEITGFAKKGEQGKVLEGKNGATAEYLSWDQSPESVKLEYNNLRSLIFDMTDTPDISIEQMKSLGTYSGIALKMLFLGAHLKASEKEETFGKGIQRRINFIKAALAVINVELEKVTTLIIEPKFEYYLPKNYEETINLLSTATGGQATMSQETAVTLNPLVKDPIVELDRIKQNSLDASLNPPL
jgi:SPP1 family phage portal protein